MSLSADRSVPRGGRDRGPVVSRILAWLLALYLLRTAALVHREDERSAEEARYDEGMTFAPTTVGDASVVPAPFAELDVVWALVFMAGLLVTGDLLAWRLSARPELAKLVRFLGALPAIAFMATGPLLGLLLYSVVVVGS
ncbi:hypothetical protein GHK92_13980 [Nocardioides sp. dk4132]|uniref:hypothetical protein n=1 Tax=unclassified Nocardioides TaxID=2615069 RepID=UPI0012980C1B|nr:MULTISPECIES: hypothetical protein [unclassified Nocardioides]MQW76986.1 hypothetical protein [Nocardioides sp. dk4132]QGA09401.1 hypothetical protein GFH29_19890 [Nocardioides sp. dk884]